MAVTPASSLSLAEGLTQLLCDESMRAQFAARGPDFARQFSSQKIAAELIELCERVVKGQPVNPLDY